MINVLDGTGGYDGKVTPRYLQRVVNRIVKYITDAVSTGGFDPSTDIEFTGEVTFSDEVDFSGATVTGIDSRPYKVYSALVSQTGTSAPTAVILENTLGGTPVFSYVSEGEYRMTLSGAFPQLKYFSPFPISYYNSTPGDGVITYYWFRENDNSVLITCLDGDGELNNAPVGFVVYN